MIRVVDERIRAVMKIKAAVLNQPREPFVIEELDIDEASIRPTEVFVKLVATGLCHTDLTARDQHIPGQCPAILGHEGAGIVEAVGSAVVNVRPGDRVVLAPVSCTRCSSCLSGHPSYCREMLSLNLPGPRPDGTYPYADATGRAINGGFFGQSSFGNYCIANESSVVKVDESVPLEILGPLGCGFQTGAGTVLNVLRPGAGESIAVFGAGPVGLAALMAAKASGCTTIVAVDINGHRLELAAKLGATHVLNSRDHEVSTYILEAVLPGGLHCSEDTTGRNEVIAQAVGCLMVRGRCALVAVPSVPSLEIDWSVMTAGRSVEFVQEGDSVPSILIPRLNSLYKNGLFPFDQLLRFYELDELNQAVADFENGTVIKAVIRMPH